MLGQVAGADRLTLYGSFTSSSSYKPMLYLALARLPFSFRTVNLKTGVQNSPGVSRDQPLGRRAVVAPSRSDDPAIERDPRLPGARDRAFRGRDRAAALAGARMAVMGGRPHHRGRAGAARGAVPPGRIPKSSPSSGRGPRRRCRLSTRRCRTATGWSASMHDRRYRLLGPHGVHGRRRFRDRELAPSRSLVAAAQGDARLRAALRSDPEQGPRIRPEVRVRRSTKPLSLHIEPSFPRKREIQSYRYVARTGPACAAVTGVFLLARKPPLGRATIRIPAKATR